MIMDLEAKLAATPVDKWTTKQAIVFDWHDGPREGLCALGHPEAEFLFELLDERHNPDDLDDRLFRLRQVPAGTVARALSVLSVLGGPTHCVWVPVWRFTDPAQQREAEKFLEDLQVKSSPLDVVIASRDLEHFQGCWRTENANGEAVDWFARLGVPATPSV
ncbi:MAG: hypothetical protein L0Y71_12330 [Gemmataceae bacterium]|nr:hypothetical protein [Gemmataceae bacterium]